MSLREINYSFWNAVGDCFLDNDRSNKARMAALNIILDYTKRVGKHSLAELGPGMGFDYHDYFLPWILSGHIKYTGIEGSIGMYDRLLRLYPTGTWVHGDFTSLLPNTYDIVYTKATLEHQPDLIQPLSLLLGAARALVVINWYRPPAPQEVLSYNQEQQIWYNTWSKIKTEECISKSGICEIRSIEDSPNVLYIVRKS